MLFDHAPHHPINVPVVKAGMPPHEFMDRFPAQGALDRLLPQDQIRLLRDAPLEWRVNHHRAILFIAVIRRRHGQ
jgi:hypothetical protein